MEEFTLSTSQVVPSARFSSNDTSRVSPTLNCLLEPLSVLDTRSVPDPFDSDDADEEGISFPVSQPVRNMTEKIRVQMKNLENLLFMPIPPSID